MVHTHKDAAAYLRRFLIAKTPPFFGIGGSLVRVDCCIRANQTCLFPLGPSSILPPSLHPSPHQPSGYSYHFLVMISHTDSVPRIQTRSMCHVTWQHGMIIHTPTMILSSESDDENPTYGKGRATPKHLIRGMSL